MSEFDRYAVERIIKSYSNDLLSAFHGPAQADESTKRNAVARAQSLITDWAYLYRLIETLDEQVRDAQRRL